MKDDSFSVDVIKRILGTLADEGNTKKTGLAGKTGLNYAALVRYIKFLRTLKWVDITSDQGSLVSITNVGRSFRKLLEQEGPQDISEEALLSLIQSQSKSSNVETASTSSSSCALCGTPIKKHLITREADGNEYFFDKSECARFFMKFRDVYGREFVS